MEGTTPDEELRIAPVTADGEVVSCEYESEDHFNRVLVSYRRKTFSGNATTLEDFQNETLEYYTPDSTMSKSNAYFLEKMKSALGECASSDTSYQTAFDNTNPPKPNRNRRSSLPKSTEMTLINDRETLHLAHAENLYRNHQKPEVKENISDDELDNDFLRYQGTQIKYEDITVEDINEFDIQDEESHQDLAQKQEKLDANHFEGESSSGYSINSSENKTINDFNCSTDFDDVSSFKQPEVKPSVIPRKKFFVTPPKNNVLRPRNENSASRLQQPRRFFHTPTNMKQDRRKTPSTADKYKYVQSPVGIYIKNSKTAAICRNVQPTKLPDVLPASFFEDIPDISQRWEFEIADVIYRPSSIQHQLRPRDIHLPENIQMLMPTVSNMYMTKHETRIPGREVDAENVRRKLHEDVDLTMCSSMLEDISILQVKPYI